MDKNRGMDKYKDLEWTGERYVPWVDDAMVSYEHLHRYKFANEFVRGKSVLDLACGEGYGSFLLAGDALEVVGIEIDETAINHARAKYKKKNLKFLKGNITDIPIKQNNLFDIIICFEALEHIKEHNELIKEVKRFMKKNGIFMVSTPNKEIYSDRANYNNPFHVKELYFKEFRLLLNENFKHTVIYGQRVYPSSNIFPLDDVAKRTTDYIIEKAGTEFHFVANEKKEARYFVAVSSDRPIRNSLGNSYLFDISESIFKEKEAQFSYYKSTIGEKDARVASLEQNVRQLSEQIQKLEQQIVSLQKELAQRSLKKAEPSLVITKIDSYEKYKQYLLDMQPKLLRRVNYERSLLTDSNPFAVGGYCYACKKKAEFLVDYQYAYEVDGVLTPNWRERLVCPSCGLNNRMRSAIHLFHKLLKPDKKSHIYLTEQRTPLFKWFSENFAEVIGSEFLGDQVAPGQTNEAGIRNEDLTHLSFSDNQFDFILSFDVLEHIPNYKTALKECLRVLKPKGAMLFTVPFTNTEKNVVREEKKDIPKGFVRYYHFGWELLDQMREIGYADASAYIYWSKKYGYLGADQILFVGRKDYTNPNPAITMCHSEQNEESCR